MSSATLIATAKEWEAYKDRLGRDRGHIGSPADFPCLVITAAWEESGWKFWQHGFVTLEEAIRLVQLHQRQAERGEG